MVCLISQPRCYVSDKREVKNTCIGLDTQGEGDGEPTWSIEYGFLNSYYISISDKKV